MKLFKKLTDRQIEILKSKNLPISWLKLSSIQKESISAIEEMLEYVEAKYNKKFCYNGYTRANAFYGDDEVLYTYAEGSDPATSTFSVERTKDGFKDGYGWVIQAPIVQADMEKRLGHLFEGLTYKMFVELTGVADDGHVKTAHIFLYVENASENQSETIMDGFIAEIQGDPIDFAIVLYSLKEGIVPKLDKKDHNNSFWSEDINNMYRSNRIIRKKSISGWEKNER